MKTEELLQSTGETFEYARQYVQQQKELIKLEIAEKTAKTISSLVTIAVLAFLAAIFLIMLSIALGLWLGEMWGSYGAAFLIVAAVYGILGGIVYFFQQSGVTNPILNKILSEMLDD